METVFTKSNLDPKPDVGSKLQIKAFIKDDPSPFVHLDYAATKVYELTDYTMRTPLEKMDVFTELLELKQECELWILQVTEATTDLLRDIPKDKTYEKTASLFTMLSTIKQKVERDRTFLVADGELCGDLVAELEKLGFTLTEKTQDELRIIKLS